MRIALALATALAAMPAVAAQGPQHWLARIAEAAVTVSYHGEVTHRHGDRVQSFEIARRAGPAGYTERILSLTGSPREVVRDGRTITCVLPAGAERMDARVPRNPFPTDGWADAERLAVHYELLDLGEDRVAGRACRVIGVVARDGFRYGYRLWVDAETGLLLRSDALDENGEVVEQVAFTRVRTPGTLDPRVLETTLDGNRVRWQVASREHRPHEPHWDVASLPPGFVAGRVREREHGTVQRVYSDGLAKVSVFVAPLADDDTRPGLSGASRMGAVSAFGTVRDGHQVTVVGEVPPATVRYIAEAVVFTRR